LPGGTLPERQRVCLRECNRVSDPAPTLAFSRTLCEFPINTLQSDGAAFKAFPLSGGQLPVAQLFGQTCEPTSVTSAGASTTVRGCTWNPDFAPFEPGYLPSSP